MENRRLIDIDIMKVFAIFFVFFNHMEDYGYYFFLGLKPGSAIFFVFLFLSVFCKFAVPLFFMMSGALLFNRDELKIGYVVKRLLKLAFIIVLFSFFRFFFRKYVYFSINPDVVTTLMTLDYGLFFKLIYQRPLEPDFWYLYLYASFLFVSPFLYLVSKNFQRRHLFYLAAVFFIFGAAVPCLEYLFSKNEVLLYDMFRNKWMYSFYPVVGYYLEHKMKDVSDKNLTVLWGVNLLTIFVSMYLTYDNIYQPGKEIKFSETFHNIFAPFNAAVLYITFKRKTENVSVKTQKVFTFLAKGVFTAFLFHPYFVFALVPPDLPADVADNPFPTVMFMINTIMFFFFSGIVIYCVLSRIPVVKKITRL